MLTVQAMQWTGILEQAMLFLLGTIAFYSLLQLIPARKRRVSFASGMKRPQLKPPPAIVLRLLLVSRKGDALAERQQLLGGAGLRVPVLWYEAAKRMALVFAVIIILLGVFGANRPLLPLHLPYLYVLAAGSGMALFLLLDRIALESLKKRRTNRIVKEIYVLSNQLLYYTGARMNLHAKLQRCLPFTRTIRADFHLLLNDWYQDAGQALLIFKNRLGTEEGHSFAETINLLRQYEHESYYGLLRQRIRDYKDKIDLIKESRKETTSYFLFVLAGLPVLNTFRIFIYPWVQEGQKLFNYLN